MWDKELTLHRALAELPEEKLRTLLNAELGKPEPEDDLVLAILHILEEREPEELTPASSREEAAWKQHRNRIRARKRAALRRPGNLMKAASLVIAVCLLFSLMSQQARAGSWWQRITLWTEDFFGFFRQEEDLLRLDEYEFRTDNLGLQQVYDAAVELGVTIPAVPMWLPEGYELAECTVVDTPVKKYIHARFLYGDSRFVFQVNVLNSEDYKLYHKDTEGAEKYEMGGNAHSVVQNTDSWSVTWSKDNTECAFSIDCDEDTLYEVIDSIYRWRMNE